MDEFTPIIPDPRPDPVSDDVVSAYLPQYSLANQALHEDVIKMQAYRLKMGEERQMRQELYLRELQATVESRKEMLSNAIDAGDVPFAEALITREVPTIPFEMATEVAAAEAGAALKMTDTPEYPVTDQDVKDNALALALNNAFTEAFAKLPQFVGDEDTDQAIKNIKATGAYAWQFLQLFIPFWYAAKKSEGEGIAAVAKDTILPGTESLRESEETWKKFQSADLNEVNAAVQEWKAKLEKQFADNPVALISAMTESLFTSQTENPNAIRITSKKEIIVNGEKIPSILPQVWDPESKIDAFFGDEWVQNTFGILDALGTGAALKAIPKTISRVAGGKAAARLAASEAVQSAGTGSKSTGYMLSLVPNDLSIVPEVQSEINKTYALADAALNDRVIVNRIDNLTGKPVEKVLRNFEGEYGKRLISSKFVQGAGDTQVEVLVGNNKGRGYASLKAAEKANERALGVYEVVKGSDLGLDGYFLKATRSVDEAGWLRGEDAAELVAGNEVKAGWFAKMWRRGAVGNESDFGRYFWSPAVTSIYRTTREAVSSSLEKAKLGAVVENMLTPIEKLSRKQKKTLAEIIDYGKLQPSRLDPEATGKWFDYGELDRLYMTKYGRNVTKEEATAYYSYKAVSDLAYVLGNEVERSKMLAEGAETWRLKNHAFGTLIGKKVSPNIADDFSVLLPDGRVVLRAEISDDDLKNFDIIETYGQAEYDGVRFSHVLADKKTSYTGGLQRNVLGYTEGGTRNYSDVWFVKQRAVQKINGKDVARNPLTHGVFRTKEDAAKYVDEMNQAVATYNSYLSDLARVERGALKKRDRAVITAAAETRLQELGYSIKDIEEMASTGKLDLNNPLEVVYDREMMSGFNAPNWERLKTYQRGGKLYYSERGQHLLQDGSPAPLVDPYVALSNQIGSMVHTNSYRNFAIREVGEWAATFGKNYEVPGVVFPSSDELLRYGEWKGPNTPEMNKLRNISESQRMYVKRVLLQPGASDIFISQAKSRLAQKLAASLGDKDVPESFRTGKIVTETSAVRGLRTLAYDLALGFFNVGQLAVQGSAALTATILHPIHGAGAIKDYGLIRAAAAADYNPKMIAVLDKRLAQSKFFGFKKGEFTKLVEDYRRSGMHLVGRTDATLDRAGAVSDGGRANTAWESIRDKLRMPLYEGERIGRITAFGIARREAQDAVAAGKFAEGSGEYFQFIQKTANKYTLNMMSGMETWWQRNQFTQLPLQFFQYPFKYMEVFLGMNKEFTEAERWRFIIGHMMLYGAYGVPLGPEAAKGVLLPGYEAATGEKPTEEVYEKTMLGLLDVAIGKMTGSETAAGSTFGSGNFVGEFIKDLYGDNSPIGLSGGIALNSITKISDAFSNAGTLWYAIAFNENLMSVSPEAISEATEITMTELGNIVRSMSNANKAYYLTQYGVLRDNKGLPIEYDSGYSAFLTAMGIRSNLEWKKWDAIESKESRKKRIQEVANMISKLQMEGEMARRDGDMDKAKGRMEIASILYGGIASWEDRMEIIQLVNYAKRSDVEGFLYKNQESLRFQQTGEE
jgi:hypothetical protein